ncbi:hypothetical protein G7Y89_g15575 [Cudoniella acicularis]|uniref:Uncharacterized protein n=1 Tax=Cudoniella acicularis TaxID=354080 RepID=A0A8H4QK91_9HELO|nr:hypothetical protein G7Y89_g15575 [Cudoniella acicularis]
MSFGWSFGDVVAGISVVWNVYQAVSDGPRSAKLEASQFYVEFGEVIGRLDEWEKRKVLCERDDGIKASHQDLKDQCTIFIKRHMKLIQQVNPNTRATRQGRSTWLQIASFTGTQIASLYQQVQWPLERAEVVTLREKLQFFLQLATWDVAIDTNDMVREFKSSHAELLSSNLKLVSSHLDLVSLVTYNLKRVTHPLEPGSQAKEIDYPMLRQFDQALRPPEPLRTIENAPGMHTLPWQQNSPIGEAEYAMVSPNTPYDQEAGPFDQNEIRGLISRRLDNMSMRVRRVETMDTISETDRSENNSSSIKELLERLRDMRNQIGNAVGIVDRSTAHDGISHVTLQPESALRQELDAWNQLEERIEREILHPGRLLAPNSQKPLPPKSKPIDIPSRNFSMSLSPPILPYDGWQPPHGSPDSFRGSLSSSPNHSRPTHSRSNSTSSTSTPSTQSIHLDHLLPVQITYSGHVVSAIVHTISRDEEGEIHSITATSQDRMTEIRHTVDFNAPSLTETSMKPFLDNGHVDKSHHFRVQFQGAHNIKVRDFMEFQSLLLNKDVRFCADVHYIKSTDKDFQCRLGTIRILLDPFSGARSILYFRHTADQKHGFVEWPGTS